MLYLNCYCRDLLIQQLMKEINELKQELARIKGEVSNCGEKNLH